MFINLLLIVMSMNENVKREIDEIRTLERIGTKSDLLKFLGKGKNSDWEKFVELDCRSFALSNNIYKIGTIYYIDPFDN